MHDEQNPVLAAIARRSSIRSFTEDPVTREQLTTLIKAAMAAPSGRNVQPWVFMVIQNAHILRQLAEVLPNGPMLNHAPAAIMVGSDMEIAEAGTPGYDYWKQDCSAATQNLLLAAEAVGLGAVWLGVTPIEERVKNVSAILRLPAAIMPLNLVAVGHPARPASPKDKFNPDRIHWEKW